MRYGDETGEETGVESGSETVVYETVTDLGSVLGK